MKIKSILVSQPAPVSDKSPYFDLAKKYDIQIDFKPFIHVEGLTSKEFREQRINILEYSAIIFTSRTAIDHFFRLSEELRLVIPDTMKYFCMSETIAFYLQKYIVYRKRKIFVGKSKFEELMLLVKKHCLEYYLLPMSETHQRDMLDALKKAKIKHKLAIMYKTVCSDLSTVAINKYDVLAFFSPYGISSLMKNFENFEQQNIKIAAFGSATAKAVKDAKLLLHIEAPTQEFPSMTMALEHYIKESI